jgi:hypothetical protein
MPNAKRKTAPSRLRNSQKKTANSERYAALAVFGKY